MNYMLYTELESRTQGSRPRPRTQKKSEAKAKAKDSLSEDRHSRGQGQECSRPRPRTKDRKRKCSPKKKKKKKKVFTKIFQAISTKKRFPKNFSSAPQNFNIPKNSAVLEPRTGQFSRTWGLEAKAKDLTFEAKAKAKDFKICPRGRPRGQGRPRGLHLWLYSYTPDQGSKLTFLTTCPSGKCYHMSTCPRKFQLAWKTRYSKFWD